MTRKEHLEFCKKCLNRKLDTKQGLICNLTQKIADFEEKCDDFNKDNKVVEVPRDEYEITPNEVKNQLNEETITRLKAQQDFYYAVIGGSLATMASAVIWAIITISINYQIGYMAIGVGILVGFAVRFFGAGIDKKFGILGGALALMGCILGNLFTQVGFIAQSESMGYFEVLSYLNLDLTISLFIESFSPMDIVFYGIATYEGYRFAFRKITPEYLHLLQLGRADVVPSNQKIRMPLAVGSLLILSFVVFKVLSGYTGDKTYFYESGKKMSEGFIEKNKEQGEWNYYYENGKKELSANYTKGIPEGHWEWFDENGNLIKEGNYNHGLEEGIWIEYYADGTKQDSGNFVSSRLNGDWKYWYPNGNLAQEGNYERNKQEGEWITYFENGTVNSITNMEDGKISGACSYFTSTGMKISDMIVNEKGIALFKNVWNTDGKQIVKNGNGFYKSTYDDGTLKQSGEVKDGVMIGIWKNFYKNGQLNEEYETVGELSKIINKWDKTGKQTITDGDGEYISYYPGTNIIYEKGTIKSGLREGDWRAYYNTGSQLFSQTKFHKGLPDGLQVTYYQSGKISTSGMFKENKQYGEWTWFYENGNISSKAQYEDGKKHGEQQLWSEVGILLKKEEYDNGNLISEEII